MIIRLLLISFLLAFTIQIQAQNDSTSVLKIESKYHIGNLLDHRQVLRYIQNRPPKAIDFQVLTNQNNKKWKSFYKYPSIGFGAYFSDLGNSEILGNVYAIYFLADFPILFKPKFELNFRFAEGYSYLTKKFDQIDNNLNVSIGSHSNLFFAVSISSRLRIYKNVELINSFGLTHYSNGSVNQPNLGINNLSWQSGFSYNLAFDKKTNAMNISKPEHYCKNSISTILNIGIKEIYPPENERFVVKTVIIQYYRQISNKRKLGFGLDVMNDPSIIKAHEQKFLEFEEKYKYCVGLTLAHDWIFGKLSFTIQQGFYLYSNKTAFNAIYQRYGFRYKIYKDLVVNGTIKTYLFKADYFEFGVGYSLGW